MEAEGTQEMVNQEIRTQEGDKEELVVQSAPMETSQSQPVIPTEKDEVVNDDANSVV